LNIRKTSKWRRLVLPKISNFKFGYQASPFGGFSDVKEIMETPGTLETILNRKFRVPGASIFLAEILKRRLVPEIGIKNTLVSTRRLLRISVRKMETPGTSKNISNFKFGYQASP
jgi:hypothetical protein